ALLKCLTPNSAPPVAEEPQLCLTFQDSLHPTLVKHIDNLVEGCPNDEKIVSWYEVAQDQWQLMEIWRELHHPHSTLRPTLISNFHHPAPAHSMPALTLAIPAAHPLPPWIPVDMNAARQLYAAPLLCRRCQKPRHFAWHCSLGLEFHKHNSKVNWTKGEVTMSRCPWKCSACAAEDRAEHWAQVQEHAAICTCHTSPLPFTDLDLLNSPPLAFSYREALYKDNQSGRGALEEEHRREFGGVHKLEFPNKVVEVGDWIYVTTIHPLPSVAEIWASQTTSQQLA
ncbi:hypothetical protein C0989_005039, partial [Termitomyces sp. Mn162]